MDPRLLIDICVALATALCVAVMLYGAWLCVVSSTRKPPKEAQQPTESEAVVRQPRPRVRAGAPSR